MLEQFANREAICPKQERSLEGYKETAKGFRMSEWLFDTEEYNSKVGC